jgi:hypothetical protein
MTTYINSLVLWVFLLIDIIDWLVLGFWGARFFV